jgi:hypothetical protein
LATIPSKSRAQISSKKSLPLSFHVLRAHDEAMLCRLQEIFQPLFSRDQRESTQIFITQPEQVKSVEDGFGPATQQLIKLADPLAIDTDDLADQDDILDGQPRKGRFKRI